MFNHGQSVFDCKVRNLSPSGALIEVPSMVGIPAQFEIVLDGTTRRACAVLWRTGCKMGVRFDGAEHKAA